LLKFNWIQYFENIGILGMQGDGKTTRAKMILDLIPNEPRIIWSPQRPTEHYSGYGNAISDLEKLDRNFYVYNGEYSSKNFIKLCNILRFKLHDMLLVVDDVHEQCTKQFIPEEFKNLILSGRNRGIHSIFISPQPNQVHNTILGSCQHMFCYRFTLSTHIEWVKDNIFGDDAWILIPENLRKANKEEWPNVLPRFSYLYRNRSEMENQLMVFGQQEEIVKETKEENETDNSQV